MAKQFYLVSEATKITDVIQTRLKKDLNLKSKQKVNGLNQLMLQGKKWQEFKKNGDEKEMTLRLVKYLGDDQGMVHLEHPADTCLAMHTQQVDTENW